MKAVTIAKIARLVVIIAVAVVLAIPTFAGVESLQINNGGFVETDSVYEVTHMTADDLASNINEVADGKHGYTINYGSIVGEAVPSDESGIKALASKIKDAAPADAKSFKATLIDPDGKVCRQQMIMGSNGLTQYITTGITLTESLVNMVKISVSLDSVLFDSRNKISDVIVDRIEDSYRITIPIPYILFATALAGGKDSQLGLSIGVEYNNFFSFHFKLDLPLEKLMNSGEGGGGGGGIPEIDCKVESSPHEYTGNDPATYKDVTVQEEIKVELPEGLTGLSDITASLGDFGGEGGVRLEVNESGKVQMMTDDPEGLVKAIESMVDEETGELTLNIQSDNPEIPSTFVIEKEYVDSFLAMSDDIIKMLGTLGAMSS